MSQISIYKKHREQIKEMIIETAVNLFREKGYEHVSVDEITMKIEIAKGTFYNYFSSKGELLVYWAKECFSGMDIQMALDTTKTVEENLDCLVGCYASAISEERALFASFLREVGAMSLQQPGKLRDFDFEQLLKAAISNSCDGTGILSDQFELKVKVLNSAIFSAIVDWTFGSKEIRELELNLTKIIRICLHGLFSGGKV